MLATIGYIVPYYYKLPQFADAPAGWEALKGIPQGGLLQILGFIGALELWVFAQTEDKEPGNIAPAWSNWKR